MSGVNNVNITLLKQYQEEFSVEKDNFNNSSYNYFLTSYIPHCSDYYVAQMSKTLDDLYDKIKNGYYNINVWWVNHNNSIEEVEDSLMDNGIKPEDVMDNFGDVNAGAAAGALAAGAAAVGGFASQAMVDAAGNVGSSEMNLNNMDASTTGATTSSNTQNLWSRFTNWVSNAAKDTGAWISNAWNTASNWVSEKATAVKDMASNVLNSTGAFLSNAWNSVTSWASEAYETINNALLAVEASVNNAVISLSKGIVSLLESVGDLFLLAGTGIVSVGTLVVDGWNCVFNDQEGLVYTNLLWDDAKAAVSYNLTDKIYDALYATEFGQYLDEHAFGFFKSDGMGCQILEGVGYAAGVVGLSVVTFGTTPLALGATASLTGLSRNTAQEWNENSFTISYDGVNTMNIALDYNQYLDLENLNIGDSRDFTQTFLDEEGNQIDITFTITKNGSNDYSVADSYGNNLIFGGLNESNTVKGLALGAVYGLWEGLQYAVGAKIGTSTFNSITSNITNTAAQKLAVSGLRVASDTLTGVVEVPFQSAVTTLADGVSFSKAWEQNGGFTSVLTQAGIAGIGSVLGEAFDLGKILNRKGQTNTVNLDNVKPDDFLQQVQQYNLLLSKVDDSSNSRLSLNEDYKKLNQIITTNAQNMDNQTLIQAFKSLDNPDVLLDALDDKKLRTVIPSLDDDTLKKIYNASDSGRQNVVKYLNKSRLMSLELTPIFRIREEAIKLITDEHGRIDYTSINKLNDTQLMSLSLKTDSALVDAVRLMDDETLVRFVELASHTDYIGNVLNVLHDIRYFTLFDGLSQDALFQVVKYMDENEWNFLYRNSTPAELENIRNRVNSFNDEQIIDLITSVGPQSVRTMFSLEIIKDMLSNLNDHQYYTLLNHLRESDIGQLLSDNSIDNNIRSKIIRNLTGENLSYAIQKGFIKDFPQSIYIPFSNKEISTSELLDILTDYYGLDNSNKFIDVLSDYSNSSGIYDNYSKFEYAYAFLQLRELLNSNQLNIKGNDRLSLRLDTIVRNYNQHIINLGMWGNTGMLKKMKEKIGAYVSEERINSLHDTFEIVTHEQFLTHVINAYGKKENVMGFNNGVRSVIDTKYPDYMVVNIMTHESIHQLSFKKISDYERFFGIGHDLYNIENQKWKSERAGLNETLTEYINEIVMDIDYPSEIYCGYQPAVVRLKQILNFNIEGFDTDSLIRGYFNNDETGMRSAIDRVMGNGYFDNRFIPAFDEAAIDYKFKNIDEVVREIALRIGGIN